MARIGHDTKQELQTVAQQTGQKLGDLVDESGWRKQGTESVGVSRQYLGSLGKVDNGQVAVFGSLVWGPERSLINTRLFLPEGWTDDAVRCDKAGIPQEARQFKTKPMLALEMVREDRQRRRHPIRIKLSSSLRSSGVIEPGVSTPEGSAPFPHPAP